MLFLSARQEASVMELCWQSMSESTGQNVSLVADSNTADSDPVSLVIGVQLPAVIPVHDIGIGMLDPKHTLFYLT